MAELRWILLLIGLAFLAALAAWESRRSRRARRELSENVTRSSAYAGPELGHLPPEFAVHSHPAGEAPGAGRASGGPPPLVELPPLDDSGTAVLDERPAGAVHTDSDSGGDAHAGVDVTAPADAAEAQAAADEAASTVATVASAGPAQQQESVPLTVNWPPEAERQIVALRIMATSEQRLSGRTARQALAACGFVHGRYGIFHQPGVDGRSLMSCANLSKPGIFDPATMDFQRFAGLSLFTVLPGPLPGAVALDRLLETGRELSHRLQAHLQDEQGHPLDESHVAQLRNSVRQSVTGAMGAQPVEPAR